MTTQHTLGPWKVDLESGEIEAQGFILGTIYGANDYPCCEDDIFEECRANASLIAAAPDLLEVAELFRAELALCIAMAGPLAEKMLDLEAKVNAAIAKARGKS
jgi:hypothetical protein